MVSEHHLYRPPLPRFDNTQACLGYDPEIFISTGANEVAFAKLLCSECPLLVECREYAYADSSVDGTWGGTTKKERVAYRKKHGAPKPPPEELERQQRQIEKIKDMHARGLTYEEIGKSFDLTWAQTRLLARK